MGSDNILFVLKTRNEAIARGKQVPPALACLANAAAHLYGHGITHHPNLAKFAEVHFRRYYR